MKKSSVTNINLKTYDDIFQDTESREDELREKVIDVAITELHTFKNHPFRVCDDEAMTEMVASIEKYGVLVPGIVRSYENGGYELIAGHRRKRGCELAGIKTMPVIIRELGDDEATIIMVDSNLQRETLLPSEKAFAYKMKLEAIKHQGSRQSSTSTRIGQKLSVEVVAEQTGESRNQVQRYIRLTELLPPLLDMVDCKKLALSAAVEISYLQQAEQDDLLEIVEKAQIMPSISQAQRLKQFGQEGKLSHDVIEAILFEDKQVSQKLSLPNDRLKKYFPSSYSAKQMEDTIIDLLENWHKSQQDN